MKKRQSPFFQQPNPFGGYQGFGMDLQNDAEKPPSIKSFDSFSMKKRHSPFFPPKPFWSYQDFAMGLPNEAKKQGSIGVEITEPIVRPINHQDFAEQNQDVGMQNTAKRPHGVEITEPIVRPLRYQDSAMQNEDMGLQNYAKTPVSIGVEMKDPIVKPARFEEPLITSQGKDIFFQVTVSNGKNS